MRGRRRISAAIPIPIPIPSRGPITHPATAGAALACRVTVRTSTTGEGSGCENEETVVKTVQAFEDVHAASVHGAPASWIPVPHVLDIETERGSLTFSVRGNVLIWQVDDVTYRLETSLDRAQAVALAESTR